MDWPEETDASSIDEFGGFTKVAILGLIGVAAIYGAVFGCTSLAASRRAYAQSNVVAGEVESPITRALHPNSSVATNLVALRFGNTIYKIPRNYLIGARQPRYGKGVSASFSLQVLLPNFAPRTPANAAEFDRVGWHNQLRALFEYPRHPRRPEEVLRFYLKIAGMSISDYRTVGDGYRYYESLKTVPHEMFVKQTPHGLLFFTCYDKKYSIPSPSCTVIESFGKDVMVTYSFSRKYMLSTAQIDDELHKLVRVFAEK